MVSIDEHFAGVWMENEQRRFEPGPRVFDSRLPLSHPQSFKCDQRAHDVVVNLHNPSKILRKKTRTDLAVKDSLATAS